MAKKLSKKIEGNIVTLTEVTTAQELVYDFAKLPKAIQEKLGPFGTGHKLGDAAAGKEGQEAVDSINKVWDGLMAGDWSVKAPAGEKVSVKSVLDIYSQLGGKEKALAAGLLAKLGIKLPEAPAAV
jgi:hypothetical protein